jgi:hypothetical protein
MQQNGYPETVGVLGGGFSIRQLEIAAKHGAEIVFCFDNDGNIAKGGIHHTLKAINTVLSAPNPLNQTKISVAVLPHGKDPDDVLSDESGRYVMAEVFANLQTPRKFANEFYPGQPAIACDTKPMLNLETVQFQKEPVHVSAKFADKHKIVSGHFVLGGENYEFQIRDKESLRNLFDAAVFHDFGRGRPVVMVNKYDNAVVFDPNNIKTDTLFGSRYADETGFFNRAIIDINRKMLYAYSFGEPVPTLFDTKSEESKVYKAIIHESPEMPAKPEALATDEDDQQLSEQDASRLYDMLCAGRKDFCKADCWDFPEILRALKKSFPNQVFKTKPSLAGASRKKDHMHNNLYTRFAILSTIANYSGKNRFFMNPQGFNFIASYLIQTNQEFDIVYEQYCDYFHFAQLKKLKFYNRNLDGVISFLLDEKDRKRAFIEKNDTVFRRLFSTGSEISFKKKYGIEGPIENHFQPRLLTFLKNSYSEAVGRLYELSKSQQKIARGDISAAIYNSIKVKDFDGMTEDFVSRTNFKEKYSLIPSLQSEALGYYKTNGKFRQADPNMPEDKLMLPFSYQQLANRGMQY